MSLSAGVLKKIKDITGKNHVVNDPEELVCYSYDASGNSFLPDAVVFPISCHEVSEILKLANRESFAVIPRGSGSGMTGGCLPVKGGIVMALTRMNHILEIDRENFVAIVEPGVVTGDFHRAVENKGLFYPPDPASSSFCTLGGNIGECAGGPRAVKYGVTRDYVLGLEAVTATGEIIHTGVRTAKGVAGYDLTRLIVGSEGTLVVVTKIILKLVPLPEKVKTLAVLFDSMQKAAETVSAVIREAVVPRCIEYMDRASIKCVENEFKAIMPDSVFRKIDAVLLIDIDGSCKTIAKDAEKLRKFCLEKGAYHVITAKDPKQASDLWKARKSLSPALFKLAPNKINEDIVVPINRIPHMVERLEKIQKETGLVIVSFGHAGDGNIHCNIMYDKRNKKESELAGRAVDELFEFTLELGGTITGEHGVGITKMKYFPIETGEIEIEIMKGVKRVFDPENILNPGKIFC